MMINFLLLLYLIITRPYVSRAYNLIEIVCEVLILWAQGVIAYIYYAEINASDATNLGWSVIILFSGVLAIHAIGMLAVLAIGIYSVFKKCCRKR